MVTFRELAELAAALSAKGHLVTIIRTADREAPMVWHTVGMVGAAVDHVAEGGCVVTSDGLEWTVEAA